jgi:hypothetical protein
MRNMNKLTPIKVLFGIILISFFLSQLSMVIYYYNTPKVIAVPQQKGRIDSIIYDCVISEHAVHNDNTIYLLKEEEMAIGMRYTVIEQEATVLASHDGIVALYIDPLYRNYLIVTAHEGVLDSGMEVIIN